MIQLSHTSKQLKGEVNLPSSKSITNRMLILSKLYEPDLSLENISTANDSQILQSIFTNSDSDMYVHDAGTAYRFLTSYCAVSEGDWVIKGTQRLHQRPIAHLVDVLKTLGADITYLDKEGCGPLKIKGTKLKAPTNLIDISHINSSQFASSLLMIAPLIEGEFNFKVNTKMSSYAYVLLTIACMRRMGFSVWVQGGYIKVSKKQKFDGEYFKIEPDWSSFYYWVSMVHLSQESDLIFPGIRLNNMQKERKKLFEIGHPSIHFEENRDGIRIVKKQIKKPYDFPEELNYSNFPDMAMTFACLLPSLGCKYMKFKGLESLKYKECNREHALKKHLHSMKVKFKFVHKKWHMDSTQFHVKENTLFDSFDDHRMAMCIAPLSLIKPICISDSSVVKKSYPHFWDDLVRHGFQINYL